MVLPCKRNKMQENTGNIILYMIMLPPIGLYNHEEKCKKECTVLDCYHG